MRKLKDDLWALCDQYAGDEGGYGGEDEKLGEDKLA